MHLSLIDEGHTVTVIRFATGAVFSFGKALCSGIKMSRRVATIEEKMKEVLAQARLSEARATELERAKKDLEVKLAKLHKAVSLPAQVGFMRVAGRLPSSSRPTHLIGCCTYSRS